MVDLNKAKKSILDFIKLKFDNYGHSFNIGIQYEYIKFSGLNENVFYEILLNLEKNGFIYNLKVTDLDGGLDTGSGWVPWFALDDDLFPGVYTFNISKEFDSLYKENKDSSNNKKQRKVAILKGSVSFSDNEAAIYVGKTKCQLPAFRNEHFFCRSIWNHLVNEFVDWDIIFENMGDSIIADNKNEAIKNKRSLRDTVYALNKRIKEVVGTDNNLFTWKDKSVKRNY
jgi:hypothetical protein